MWDVVFRVRSAIFYIFSGSGGAGRSNPPSEAQVLLIPFVLLLQALGPAPQVTDPGAVWGTVRDGTAGRALAGVEIAEASGRAALSDSAGRYRLDGLRP